jgi:tryptophan synthase beta chain
VVIALQGRKYFAGISFPFIYDKIHGAKIDIIPVEPSSCPTLTRGPFLYDHGDTAKMTPLLPMYTLGHSFIPEPIHAGGLRYHGMSPLVSAAYRDKLINPVAIDQIECYEAGILFARTEGIVPAPETTHAIAGAMREAKKAKEEGKEKVILFNFSGHGLMDMMGYDKYLTGKLVKHEMSDKELFKYLKELEDYPKP